MKLSIKPKVKSPSLLVSLFKEDKTSIHYKIRQMVFQAAKEAMGEKGKINFAEVKLEHPKIENYGDYATNLAMILAGRLGLKPFDIAQRIERKLDEYIKTNQTITSLTDSKTSSGDKISIADILENVMVAKPGFLNLTIKTDYLITQLVEVLKSEDVVLTTHLQNKKIAVEYTDPNPFKEFHLGHLYSNAIGEAISRLFEANGAKVWRGDFYGDVGMHIAKSLWGMIEKMKNEKFKIKHIQAWPLNKKINFLGQAYALGVVKYEEDKNIAKEIEELNLLIFVAAQDLLKKAENWQSIVDYRQYIKGKEKRLEEVNLVYEAGLKWSLEYFETIYKKLGTKFDGYYPESWVGELGMKLVNKGLKLGVLEKSDGAVVYRGEKDGLHTRVFVNKLGLPTYEAKDLGLAQAKYQDFKYDLSLNVSGKEIDEYYQVVKSALLKIEPELGRMAYHIPHGMVRLPKGKMSSRTGTVVTFEWLIEEVKGEVLKIMKDNELSQKEKETIAETVGLGAIKYALLRGSCTNDVVFDLQKSVSLEGDSGPYLIYTYVRCQSVIKKSKNLNTGDARGRSSKLEFNPEEAGLLHTLYRFPEVVSEAAFSLSPNLIAGFLHELSQKYNLFYQKHSILSPVNPFRLFLTEATAHILQKGLWLLGIATVERM